MITNKKLVDTAIHMATKEKSLYVNGCYAKRLTAAQKKYYIEHYSYNRGILRKPKINAASEDTIGADCICFIKAIIDGWNEYATDDACGVKYVGAHDLTEKGLLDACGRTASKDFSRIVIGEFLYNEGHGGLYIGDGLCVECTPSWKDGIQITAVRNITNRNDYNGRTWTAHGKLPWVDYSREIVNASVPMLQYGAVGEDVKRLQVLLNSYGFTLDVDGSFGPATRLAVKSYQAKNGLDVDGSVGPATWSKLIWG